MFLGCPIPWNWYTQLFYNVIKVIHEGQIDCKCISKSVFISEPLQAANDSKRKFLSALTSITQNTSIHQNVWMTWYVYLNVIIVWAHNFSIAGPVCQNDLKSTIEYGGFDICFIVIVQKFTVCFYDDWFHVKVNGTGTDIPGLTFNYKQFFAVIFLSLFLHIFSSCACNITCVSSFNAI